VGLKHLISLEKWTCLLAAIAIGAGMLLLDRHAAFSLTVGAALSSLNAIAIRRLTQRLGAVLTAKPGLTVLLFNLKMGLLIGLVFAAIRWLHVDVMPLLLGISLMPLSIVIVAIQHALKPAPPAASDEETHG
jgi:ATP synthase I subunit